MVETWIPVIVAVLTGAFSVFGVVVTTNKNARDIDAKLEKTQAVFEATVTEQIKQLQREVERHNSVIARTYELEKETELHEARIRALENGGNK